MRSELIYDWNSHGAPQPHPSVAFADETLRDGLQSPSVRHPSIEQKIELLHLMEELGIDYVDIGLPGAGGQMARDTERLAIEIAREHLKIRPYCAARTLVTDIQPIVDLSQKAGIPVEATMFIGSSPIRQYAENWTIDLILKRSEEALRFARRHQLPVGFVTEDTVRSHPHDIRRLYRSAVELGADALVVCDTVGHVTPVGAAEIIRFVRREVVERAGRKIRLDWHGHNDRGLALINSIAAIEAGADQVHGTALGIGERVGNTALDQLLVNFRLMGSIDRDLTALGRYCRLVSEFTGLPIPSNYPVLGADAFRTATGVHAAAVIKALNRNDPALANSVYSGTPAHYFGLEQIIEIGPMSGKSNVHYWLQQRGIEPTPERVERVLALAKRSNHILGNEEIFSCLEEPGERT